MRWFRWYRGSSENPKFAVVARRASNPSMNGSGDRVDGAVSLTDVLAVWCVILEDAASDDHWGTCAKDAEYMAAVLDWRNEEIESILSEMVKIGLLDARTESGYHVAKWEQYQYSSDTDPTNAERQRRYYNRHKTHAKRTPNALAKRPDTDTDTEREKSRTRTPSAAPTRGSRFPHEAMPEPWKQFCREKRPDLDPSATFDRCRDYWIAQPGQRGVKRDWDATWRNWVRNERKQLATAPPVIANGPPPGFREAKSTGEYIEYLRHKHNDPAITFGDYRMSKYQYVPADWTNVTPIRKVSA